LSLLLLLLGTLIGSFSSFQAQESLPKGELSNFQNPIKTGIFSKLPRINIRANDFWVNYSKHKIRQFYSNISILDSYGNEIAQKTISVNNPLHLSEIDFYQSDWNLMSIRIKKKSAPVSFEVPLFFFNKNTKLWVTWIEQKGVNYSLVFNQLQNTFLIYDKEGIFLKKGEIGDNFFNKLKISEVLPSTGLLLKSDQSISIIYLGFGLLMITASLSYLPYTQIWSLKHKNFLFLGGCTNRGKIQLEIEFENLVRHLANKLTKNRLVNFLLLR
jgi:cytochrome c biogenesis protein